jgi:hypothetical protein
LPFKFQLAALHRGAGGGDCWCLFGEYATRVVRVSTAVLRCAEAPPAGHEAAAESLRLACSWGMSGAPRHAQQGLAPVDAWAAAAAAASGGIGNADVNNNNKGGNNNGGGGGNSGGEGGGGGGLGGGTLDVSGDVLAVGGRLPVTLLSRPRLEEVKPMRAPARGGVSVTLTGVGFHTGGDGGGVYACRFGSIGPVAAQHLSPHEVQCVSPAVLGGAWARVGITPNNGAEHEWGGALSSLDKIEPGAVNAAAGLYRLNPVVTRRLETAWFQPLNPIKGVLVSNVESAWFQPLNL